MREFRGWRRKTGCVTLLLACAFLAGWIRSRFITDTLVVTSNMESIIYNFGSDEFGLRFVRSNFRPNPMFSAKTHWSSSPLSQRTQHPNALDKNNPGHKWSFCGVHWGSSDADIWKGNFFVCVVSYWHIITPLTLLSAWLLLWNPKRKAESRDQPITLSGSAQEAPQAIQ